MYGWLWRVLPGAWWVRMLVLMVLAVGIVVLCFEWLFPLVADGLSLNQQTVGAHDD